MISRKENEKVVSKLYNNRLNKISPKNLNELASELGITRQALYYAMYSKDIKCSKAENKIREWLKGGE